MRPWHKLKIFDSAEALISLPNSLYRIEPHPYFSLGAPYGDGVDPWRLRVDVVRRLLLAQTYLQLKEPKLRFAIFDAWRPISVQAFMINYVVDQQCTLRGINPVDRKNEIELQIVIDEVARFWAPPSSNPCTPPPHSTGAAIDLTLADNNGSPLDMGGEIDAIGNVSSPDHYANFSKEYDKSLSTKYHSRRVLLRKVMNKAGFMQHPNEWWHFSFGDQMWAWGKNLKEAIYGAYDDESKLLTD